MSDERLAILYFGAMGQAWTKLLKPNGVTVMTTVANRGQATATAAKELGAEILPSIDDIARNASIIVSLVAPEAAEEVGMSVADSIARVGSAPIFVECNATSPKRTERIAKAIQGAGGRYVDGCVVGPASRLGNDWSVCYLSGEYAPQVAEVISGSFPVKILGDGISTVSSFKMTYAAFNRGLGSLLIEAFMMAERYSTLDIVLDYMYARFPDVMKQMDYYLPGMPAQAARRVGEMLDVAGTMEECGMQPSMVPQAVTILRAIARADLPAVESTGTNRDQVAAVIRLMSDADILAPDNLKVASV